MKSYRKDLRLLDKTIISTRLIETTDIGALYDFFSRIPKSDLLIYKNDLTVLNNIENWVTSSNDGEVFLLVALSKDKIVAKGSLQSGGPLWSHAAELKLIVDPLYREKGLGSQLFNILLYEGLKRHFQKIVIRYVPENSSFVKILDHYGFKPESVLNFYAKDDTSGIAKDLVIASFSLENWQRRFEFYSFIYRQ